MFTDYKFKSITRDGKITKVRVAFFEGAKELDKKGVLRYQRSKKLREEEFSYSGDKMDNELRIELNNELVKDLTRTVIDEQKN